MIVLKNFNTSNRRLKKDDVIKEGDDLAPHTIESLQDGGFIADEPASGADPYFGVGSASAPAASEFSTRPDLKSDKPE